MEEIVLDFIHRRFPIDNDWLNGNCYYFAQILRARFPDSALYYDVVLGHFIVKIQDKFYDWSGVVNNTIAPIRWDTFSSGYDIMQYKRIVKDCLE